MFRYKILCVFFILLHFSCGQECDTFGIFCMNCTSYQKCNPNGSPEGEIVTCKNGNSCGDIYSEYCKLRLDCYAITECTENGIFADALVETNYYVCIGDSTSGFQKYEFSCPVGNYFDDTTKKCNPKAEEPTTVQTTSEVTTASDITTLSSEITTELTASQATTTELTTSQATTTELTPSGSTSSPLTTLLTTTPETPSTPFTLTTPTPSTSLPETTTTASPVCVMPGTFPVSTNWSSYFNEITLKCSMIITPACQKQILNNATTTPVTIPSPPTVLITTTTTTTPKPTEPPTTKTTTTVATTTTIATPATPKPTDPPVTTSKPIEQTTPKQFSCPSSGTYANPVSCKTYFRCSPSGTIFTFTCPGTSYYNEFTRRCSAVVTPRCKTLLQG